MGVRPVPARSDDLGPDFITIGQDITFTNPNLASFNEATYMEGNHSVQPLNRAIIDHPGSATFTLMIPAFLGRLKEQPDFAIKKLILEQHSRSHEHRGMSVMAAGMHFPWNFRFIFYLVCFQNRQSIHICPDTNHPPFSITQPGHHPSLPNAC